MDAFTRLTSWIFPSPEKKQQTPKPSNPRTQIHYSQRLPRKIRESKSIIDKEYNIVLVPSDGDCLSESDSDESDWSIGWLEPHGTDFEKDFEKEFERDEKDSSFAVLVPCYKTGTVQREGRLNNGFMQNVSEGRNYIEQWLSSLQSPNVNNQFEIGSTSANVLN